VILSLSRAKPWLNQGIQSLSDAKHDLNQPVWSVIASDQDHINPSGA
jgi:hypothetical protein